MQDLAFGGRIQTFCRFIEQHQRRIVEQRAGNGQSAQFAAGELTPAFAQPAVKTTILQQFFETHLLKGSAEMSVIRSGAASSRLSRRVALNRCTRCGTTLIACRRVASLRPESG